MPAQSLVTFVVIGLVAGWVASFITGGSGLLTYLVSGVVGAYVGPVVLTLVGFDAATSSLFGQIVVSAIGAVVVVFLARLIA